ncbi:caspase family protein [Pantanalinema rosaneae CENA516]|uniref:caspase family protein n=1 Tax=Pantanalinema rosaneae TaxID=1620701 RepID=UPI003D6DAFBF
MRQWAIAIGINQYQFFQPLTYAQRDAQALRHILASEAGFLPERCILLSDNSPPVRGKSTYPNRENILDWIDRICREMVQPGDILWLFFSGYGACEQEQDYLMPVEGNPATLSTTGIPLATVFERVRTSAATTLVLLDVNRSQGSGLTQEVGRQTAQLAQESGVATILSCQPGQFSHEVATLRQSLFTATLVECLRHQQCTTLASLDRYLHHRLPELSEHSWQPMQQPLTICQPEQLHQVILPQVASPTMERNPITESALPAASASVATNEIKSGQPNAAEIAAALDFAKTGQPRNGQGATQGDSSIAPPPAIAANGKLNGHHSHIESISASSRITPLTPKASSLNGNGFATHSFTDDRPMTQPNQTPTSPSPLSAQANAGTPEEPEMADAVFWRPMLLWGGLLTAFLLVGVLWRNWSTFFPGQPVMAQPANPTQSQSTQVRSPSSTPGTIVASTQTIAASPPATVQSPTVTSPVEAPSPVVPLEVKPPVNSSIDVQSLDGSLMQALIRNDHASPFSSAIQDAGKIQPGQPGYAQAQQNIALWSNAIYTIALQRAQRRHYDTAVQAAVLVPPSQAELYNQARTAVSQEWCPLISKGSAGPLTLQEAKKLCAQKS